MSEMLIYSGGRSLTSSDSLTAIKSQILESYTAITKDSNDEPIAGTMKNVSAIDTAISISQNSPNLYFRITNGAHVQNANPGYPEVTAALPEFGNAGAGDTLSGKIITSSSGFKVSGSMTNQGAKTTSLNCGGSYTIPAGYHNGSGKITANSLSSQTSATAVAGNVVKDKTGWVNGSKITGTLTSYTGSTNRKTISPSSSTQTWKIPWGYHDGNGYVTCSAITYGSSKSIWATYYSETTSNSTKNAYPMSSNGISANGTNGFKILTAGTYRVIAELATGSGICGLSIRKNSTSIEYNSDQCYYSGEITCAVNDIIYVCTTNQGGRSLLAILFKK